MRPRSTDDGRIEFAIQQRLPDGSWSDYRFGRARFFGPSLHDGQWKHASPVEVELPIPHPTTPAPVMEESEPAYGGDLRIVSQGSISTLDPVHSLFYVVNAVAAQMYEGLYGWDGNMEVAPRLAEWFTTNAEGTRYTFNCVRGSSSTTAIRLRLGMR